jgi:hypothetical protein
MTRYISALFVLLVIISASAKASSDPNVQDRQWNFTVYLDDREIGYHRFIVDQESEYKRVVSEAQFDVKIWFINAYEYRHYNREIWKDGCLVKVNAATDDNGELSQVVAQRRDGQLMFSRPDQKQLEGCIRSYAYWSPDLLDTQRLLNTQTGEYQDVKVEYIGHDRVMVRNRPEDAKHYRIRNTEFVIDLWYSDDNQWLALQSSTEDGATLRYRIQ